METRILLRNPQNGQEVEIQVPKDYLEHVISLLNPCTSEANLVKSIDNLSLSSEVKMLLYELSRQVVRIGDTVLFIGRKILEISIYFVRKYPNTSTGMIVGSVIGMLAGSIPIVGWLLGWLILPLCTAIGLSVGFWKDLQENEFIRELNGRMGSVFGGMRNIHV